MFNQENKSLRLKQAYLYFFTFSDAELPSFQSWSKEETSVVSKVSVFYIHIQLILRNKRYCQKTVVPYIS